MFKDPYAVRCHPGRPVLLALLLVVIASVVVLLTHGPSRALAADPPATGDVLIGHAGMLNELVRLDLAPALAPRGITVNSAGGNSLTIARGIRDGSLPADLFGSADANANQLLMGDANASKVRWFATFARAEIILAYSPRSRFLEEFEKAQRGEQPWYEPLKLPGVRVARANPDSDPSGYFTVLVGQLSERFSGEVGLKQQILGDDRNPAQMFGPTSATEFFDGEIDALFMYRHLAAVFDVPFLSLPAEVNLGEPAYESGYATASFTNAAGETFRGGVIRPTMAPVEGAGNAPAALQVLKYLLSPEGREIARARGFHPGPVLVGGDLSAVPPALRQYVEGTYAIPCPPGQTGSHPNCQAPPSAPPPLLVPVQVPVPRPPEGDARPPVALVVARDVTLRTLRSRGVTTRFSCSKACEIRVSLRFGSTTVGRRTVRIPRAGRGTFRVQLTTLGKRLLGSTRARQLVLSSEVTDAQRNRVTDRSAFRATVPRR